MATMRGIPQIFAGDEYGMKSTDMSLGHSTLRRPLPQASELTAEEKDMFDFQAKLFQFRKSEPIIHNGKTMHFFARDNTYSYFRYADDGAVFVFLNASDDNRTIPVSHYAEILDKYQTSGKDIISDKMYDLTQTDISIAPLSAVIIKLGKK